MTAAVSPTFGQIRAQVAAIRKKDPETRFIGIRSPGRWEGDPLVCHGDETYRIVQCDAPLQLRMALQEPSEDVTVTVLLTPLEDRQLSDDIRVRLARRQLHPMDRWQTLRTLFGAKYIDPRITDHSWMADMLMALSPPNGYPPVPSGVLDAETAWDILLTRYLKMDTGKPDLRELVTWASDVDHVAFWRSADDSFRSAAVSWIHQTAGPSASAILNCVTSNSEPVALPVGLVLGVIYHEDAQGRLEKSAGRLEQLTGNAEIEPHIATRWHAAAVDALHHDVSKLGERRIWLEKSDAILKSVGAEAYAYLSDVSPIGFEQRLARLGSALADAVSRPAICVTDDIINAKESILSHHLAGPSQKGITRRVERVEMAVRLLRWMENMDACRRGAQKSLAAAAEAYSRYGCFVDWARQTLRGGEPVKALSQAYTQLLSAAGKIREAENKIFAELLRDWTQAGSTGASLLPIERVLETWVAPLSENLPVLVLLIDGMSCAVFQELLADITAADWTELGKADGSPLPPVLAAIPSWTQLSRTSFFCGTIREGNQNDEVKGLADHPSLNPGKASKSAPVLFHKVDVTDSGDGSLAEEVREHISAKSNRVVAVVINAVDDHLLKGDQTDPRWTADYIRALPALLYEAKIAGRAVVLLSDHGHTLENGTSMKPNGDGERWRSVAEPPADGEIRISGSRVLAGGAREVIALWTESARYGMKKNGYHGGISPQEMLVPMAILIAQGTRIEGWIERPRYVPSWWDEPLPQPIDVTKIPSVEVVRQKQAPSTGQLSLFASEPPETKTKAASQSKTSAGPSWFDALMASDVYQAQKAIAGRGIPDDDILARMLSALLSRGGKMTDAALARALGLPEFRLAGLIAAAQRVLNVEGYAILDKDDPSGSVSLNLELLKRQFGLDA